MPPPELSGNTPVPDIVCPVKIYFIHAFRQEGNLSFSYCLCRRPNQLIHFHKPLLLYHGFYGGITAVMGSHIVGMGHYLYQKPLFLQLLYKRGNHGLGMKRVKAAVDKYQGYLNLANEPGIFAAEVTMPLADFS